MEVKSSDAQNFKNILKISWQEFFNLCISLANNIAGNYRKVYGVPTGGCFVAREMLHDLGLDVVDNPSEAFAHSCLVVDDIVDSGKTIDKFKKAGFTTASLFTKETTKVKPHFSTRTIPSNTWVQFPWETKRDIEDTVVRQLEYIGELPTREGLIKTPKRIVASWEELYSGYGQNPEEILKEAQFKDYNNYDQIIILKDIDFFSMCEHHMMPFFGKVHIGYLPDKNVAGISKLARMVDCFSKRLQIQERLTEEIASTIFEILKPQGVGVVVEATHLCMVARGVKKRQPLMITSAVKGKFQESILKDEFFSLIGGTK